MKWNYWVLLGLALWLIISPWLLGFSGLNLVLWNNLMVGGLIIIFTLWHLSPPNQ
ncbi:MAG: SPW repeat protein [Patescibacteria group bacterium]